MIKSKRTRWAGLVARMWEKRNGYRLLVGNIERRDHWEFQDISGCIILKLNLEW
jgi:hypothetical protein